METETAGKPRRWVNSSILGIGLASLCSDAGHEMATAAMPALLASLGAGSAVLGLIEGLADGLSSAAKLLSGLYGDRLEKRKPLAVAGYFVTAAGMGSFALAASWPQVLLGRVGGWLGRGARSPVRKVLLAEATTPETYGRAFGLERAMDSAGAVIGPLLALLVTSALGLRWTFALTLIPGLLAALVIVALVKERPHEPRPDAGLRGGWRDLPSAFKRRLAGVGLAGAGDFSNTLLILWATQAWTPAYGRARAAELAMLFYTGYNAVFTASCYVSGHLSDFLPKKTVLSAGYALAAVPAAALLLPGASLVKFAAVFAISGLYMGVWETVESATAADLLPPAVRGFGFGVLSTVNGLGDLASSVVVGALWLLHPGAAMGYVIATALGGAALIAAS
ncbi:MAG TPA: MFS transporter [Elusimicrobiota bacterium]|jgi:MFS family permease|nr:MFS transporter [Elusimicrobiota bacterium]